MTNYPEIYSTPPWTEREEVQELLKCFVSEDLYPEEEMILDVNNGRWFHKSKVSEYVGSCAMEFNWNEEEIQGALKEFNQ
jgi:hypothetical protein